jgi:hypothetical protein
VKIICIALAALTVVGCGGGKEKASAEQMPVDEELKNAATLLGNGLHEQAVAMLNARLTKRPDDPQTYMLLGVSELLKEDFDKATKPYFESAIKVRPQLKEGLFNFLSQFGLYKGCSIFGISFPELKDGGLEGREYVIWWMLQTDKEFALSKEQPSYALALTGHIEVDEFLKRFPTSGREVELRLAALEYAWGQEQGASEVIVDLANDVIAAAPKDSDAAKRAREILAEAKAIEAEIAADEKRMRERAIIGVWEPVGTGFAAYVEFGDDGMYSVGIGALKETNKYEVHGNTLKIWSKNFVDGTPYPPSTVTWKVEGTKLTLKGGSMNGEYRRR